MNNGLRFQRVARLPRLRDNDSSEKEMPALKSLVSPGAQTISGRRLLHEGRPSTRRP